MKTIKSVVLILMALVLAFAVISCGDKPSSKQPEDKPVVEPFVPRDYSAAAGTGTLNAKIWFDSTVPTALDPDVEGNTNVGWKDYNVYWKGEKLDSTGKDKKADLAGYNKSKNTGTITDEVYNAEYKTRDQILNRVYNKSTGKYEDDTSASWDLTALKAEFGITD